MKETVIQSIIRIVHRYRGQAIDPDMLLMLKNEINLVFLSNNIIGLKFELVPNYSENSAEMIGLDELSKYALIGIMSQM